MAIWNLFRIDWRLGASLVFASLLVGACGGSSSTEPVATIAAATTAPESSSATMSPEPGSDGGDTVGLDDALDQVIVLYNEILVRLVDVTDEASAEVVVDDLSRISNQVEDLEALMGDYSSAEITDAALFGRFLSFRQAINTELNRISTDRAAFDLVSEAFEVRN